MCGSRGFLLRGHPLQLDAGCGSRRADGDRGSIPESMAMVVSFPDLTVAATFPSSRLVDLATVASSFPDLMAMRPSTASPQQGQPASRWPRLEGDLGGEDGVKLGDCGGELGRIGPSRSVWESNSRRRSQFPVSSKAERYWEPRRSIISGFFDGARTTIKTDEGSSWLLARQPLKNTSRKKYSHFAVTSWASHHSVLFRHASCRVKILTFLNGLHRLADNLRVDNQPMPMQTK